MFQLMKSDTFTAHVKGTTPDGRPFSAEGEFKLPDEDQLAAIEAGDMGDEETLRTFLEGWTNFRDLRGDPIEYTEEHRDQVIRTPYTRRAFATAFIAGVYGAGGRRKN